MMKARLKTLLLTPALLTQVKSSDYLSSQIGQPLTSKAGSHFHSQFSWGVALRKCLLAYSPFTRRPSGRKCGNISEFR